MTSHINIVYTSPFSLAGLPNDTPVLLAFSGGRVITFGFDYVITLFGGMALVALLPIFNSFTVFGITFNLNEVFAKVVAAAVVIVCNYVFSKLFVFKKKR